MRKILLEGRVIFIKINKTQKEDGYMVRCSNLFSQVLSLIDRQGFHRLVMQHHAEKHAKGFSSWSHFVAMLFCQLAQAKSLREICGGLACCVGKIKHLGLRESPKKSTLCYANANRPWEMYQDLFYRLLERYQGSMTPKFPVNCNDNSPNQLIY